MSITRITISVPSAVAKRIKKAAGKTPVSTWITERLLQHLEQSELDRVFEEYCRDLNPTADELRAADDMVDRIARKRARAAE